MTHTFKLERPDGTPADPPSFKAAVPKWRAGDTIHLGRGRTLRVVGIVVSADDGTVRPDRRGHGRNGF